MLWIIFTAVNKLGNSSTMLVWSIGRDSNRHEKGQPNEYTYRVTDSQGSEELVQCVEILDIVLGFVSGISDPHIQFSPSLHSSRLGILQSGHNRLTSRQLDLVQQAITIPHCYTVANKTLHSRKTSRREWCRRTQEIQWYESYSEKMKVWRNKKIFEILKRYLHTW